jgi:hypothetical protein
MSYLSDASLVMIPSGVEAGTVFASKPAGGSADLTFTRSNDTATRVGPNGYIEKVRTNMFLQSNQFDTTWTLEDVSVTSGQSGYDGSNNAWKLQSTVSGRSWIDQLIPLGANIVLAFSVYAKAGNVDFLKFIIVTTGSNSIVTFDLSDGSSTLTNNEIDVKSENVGNDWYRLSLIAVPDTAITSCRFEIRDSADSPDSDVGSFIYIQDAQLEYGLVATDYIETTTAAVSVGPVANVPRINFDPALPRTGSLLLEPQRTNILPQSEFFGASDWVKINTSVTTNTTTSPEGVVNASSLTEDTSSGFHVMYDNIVAAFSTAHTLSAFVKPNGRNVIYLRMENAATGSGLGITYFNISTGQILTDFSTSSSIEAYANGWYRVSITATTPSANSTLFAIGLADADNSRSYTGDGTSGIYLYGAQAEPSASYPTSYIPTYGAAVTRGGDICYRTGISDLIGQTEGTLFFDWIMNHESPNTSEDLYTLTMTDGTGDKVIGINNYNQTLAVFIKDTTMQFFDNSYTSGADGARIKLALAYANNDIALYINGAQIATDSSATIPTLSQVRLNTFWNGNLPDISSVNQLLLFQTRLTNDQLSQITTL